LEDEGDLIEILRKMFEGKPEKSTIEVKDKCSDCGCEIIVNITSTGGGFGLQGGVLFKSEAESTLLKCPDCNKLNPKMNGTKVKNNRRKAQTNE